MVGNDISVISAAAYEPGEQKSTRIGQSIDDGFDRTGLVYRLYRLPYEIIDYQNLKSR